MGNWFADMSWFGGQIAGENARRVERVLDVRQGELCWVAGTIYMDMPLKPNILDDLTKEVKYYNALLRMALILILATELYVSTTSAADLPRSCSSGVDSNYVGRRVRPTAPNWEHAPEHAVMHRSHHCSPGNRERKWRFRGYRYQSA